MLAKYSVTKIGSRPPVATVGKNSLSLSRMVMEMPNVLRVTSLLHDLNNFILYLFCHVIRSNRFFDYAQSILWKSSHFDQIHIQPFPMVVAVAVSPLTAGYKRLIGFFVTTNRQTKPWSSIMVEPTTASSIYVKTNMVTLVRPRVRRAVVYARQQRGTLNNSTS